MVKSFVVVVLSAGLFTAPASRVQGLGKELDMIFENPWVERTSGCMMVSELPKSWTYVRYIDVDICDQGLYLYFNKPNTSDDTTYNPYLYGMGASAKDYISSYLYGTGSSLKIDILGVKRFAKTDRIQILYACNPTSLKLTVENCDDYGPIANTPTPLRPRAKIAAIFLDYDGCGDLISPSNPNNANNSEYYDNILKLVKLTYRRVAGYLLNALEKIGQGRDKVILFVGSNRQDVNHDRSNQKHNGNGLALGMGGGFELLEAKYKEKGWELNRALLADRGVHGSAWNNDSKTYDWHIQEVVKQELAENNFKQLQNLGPVDVFFIDDQKKYIDYARHHAKVPQNINFYTIHYDWYAYAMEGVTKELVAEDVDDHVHSLS